MSVVSGAAVTLGMIGQLGSMKNEAARNFERPRLYVKNWPGERTPTLCAPAGRGAGLCDRGGDRACPC